MNPLLLIAEDDPTLTDFINSVCLAAGLIETNFRFFQNGKELIDFLELRSLSEGAASQPIRIISDFRMPFCDGLALLSWIRAHPVYRDLPFTLMSSFLTSDLRVTAKSLNATEVVLKPEALAEWLVLVEAWKTLPSSIAASAPEPPQIGF